MLLIGAALIGLVPAFVWLAPRSTWHRGVLLGCLAALAATSVVGESQLKRMVPVKFDATYALAVVALVVGGPLPAFLVDLAADLVPRLLLRPRRLFTPGFAANLASYGWAAIAGAGLLQLSGVHTLSPAVAPTVVSAGLAMWAVNWLIARGLFGTLCQGYKFLTLLHEEYLSLMGVQLGVTVLGAFAVILLRPLGDAVVFVLAPTILIPQLVLPALARSRDVSRLDQSAAAKLYVRALAAHLGIRRRHRRAAEAGATLLLDPARPPIEPAVAHRAWFASFYAGERWDGTGRPARLRAGAIPGESRLLATAVEWAKLTAAGGPQLPQREAILALEMEAATRLDPKLVAAAAEIVHTEAQFAELENFQPALDLLPLPRPVRSQLIPWALRAYS